MHSIVNWCCRVVALILYDVGVVSIFGYMVCSRRGGRIIVAEEVPCMRARESYACARTGAFNEWRRSLLLAERTMFSLWWNRSVRGAI